MAHSTTIADWLINNIDKYDITFTELGWPRKYGLPFFDFACDLKINNVEFVGRGSSINRDEAIIKSFAEATERMNLKNSTITTSSNGIASHSDLSRARENAMTELIERDSFLCHFLTTTAFATYSDKEIPENIKSWIFIFKKFGVELFIRKMSSPDNLHCVFIGAFGENADKPFGLVIATACDSISHRAMSKAFMEVSRAVADKIENDLPKSINLRTWDAIESHQVWDHYRIALDSEYANWFRKNYLTASPLKHLLTHQNKIDVSKIKFKIITKNQDILKGLPIVTVRAWSPLAQEMYWGPVKPELLNLQRISQFKGMSISMEMVTNVPHPFR